MVAHETAGEMLQSQLGPQIDGGDPLHRSLDSRNEFYEKCIDTIYGLAYELAGTDPGLTEEYFQEISLNVLEVLSGNKKFKAKSDDTVHSYTARLAEAARVEASFGLDAHEPHIDSWEEYGQDLEKTHDETSESAISAADSEIYERRLEKFIGGRTLEILSALIIDEATQDEVSKIYEISPSRVSQIANHALLKMKYSFLGESWKHGYTYHRPQGEAAQRDRYSGPRT